jgi:mercuric ion transport protein
MQKERLTVLGSILAAVAASICCIGPLVAVMLGVGSLAAASGLQKSRPLFLGATFVLLGGAWYLTYRKPKAEQCAEGAACAAGPAARGGEVVLWVATALAVALAALPLYAGAVARLLHPEGAGSARSAGANVATMEVKIPSMDCAGCAVNIQRALRKEEGVGRAEVVFKTKDAVIEYDPAKISPKKIIAVIDETGFKAEPSERKQ